MNTQIAYSIKGEILKAGDFIVHATLESHGVSFQIQHIYNGQIRIAGSNYWFKERDFKKVN